MPRTAIMPSFRKVSSLPPTTGPNRFAVLWIHLSLESLSEGGDIAVEGEDEGVEFSIEFLRTLAEIVRTKLWVYCVAIVIEKGNRRLLREASRRDWSGQCNRRGS